MIGRTLGPYEIQGKLGEGGMGVVYKARDTRLDRLVAIKVLRSDSVGDPERHRRFIREAKAASSLNHPGIVTIYEIAEADGVDFIAMELIDGTPLDAVIRRRPLRMTEALDWAVQIAAALARAHDAGLVHRDLKPANIMITADGRAKILDFGLAKLTQADPSDPAAPTIGAGITKEGVVVGTAPYMSPEQAQGKAVDARSDVFSFGAVLYEMVTGVRAFPGDSPATIVAAILLEEPTPASAITVVPRDVERAIVRCLRKDPARRFQHTSDLAMELDEVRTDITSGFAPAPAVMPARRSRTWLTGSILAIAVIAVGGGWYVWTRTATAPTAPVVVALTSYEGLETSPSFSPDGRQVAFAWTGGDKTNQSHIYVKLVGSEVPPLRLTSTAASDVAPAWSPDGAQIAFVRLDKPDPADASLYVTNPLAADAGRRIAAFRRSLRSRGPTAISWSPDGRWLAAAAATSDKDNALVLFPVEGGPNRQVLAASQAQSEFRAPAFSPDGAQLAYIGCSGVRNCDVFILDLAADLARRGEPRALTHGHAPVEGLAWLPDRRSLLYATEEYLQRVSAGGASLGRIELAGTSAAQPAVSRVGDRLAWSRQTRDADLFRIEPLGGDATPRVFLKSTLDEYEAAFSADGNRIAFVSNRGGRNDEIWIANRDGSDARQLTRHGEGWKCGSPRWSNDGAHILFDAAGPNGVWQAYVADVATGDPPRHVVQADWEQNVPVWSHDEKWIYFSRTSAGPGIWRTGWPSGPTEQVVSNASSPFASADGKSLFYRKLDNRIWMRSLADGSERALVATRGRCYFPTMDRVYYVPPLSPERPRDLEVAFVDLPTGQQHTLTRLTADSCGSLAVSPDNKTILVAVATNQADLMLMEHFR